MIIVELRKLCELPSVSLMMFKFRATVVTLRRWAEWKSQKWLPLTAILPQLNMTICASFKTCVKVTGFEDWKFFLLYWRFGRFYWTYLEEVGGRKAEVTIIWGLLILTLGQPCIEGTGHYFVLCLCQTLELHNPSPSSKREGTV